MEKIGVLGIGKLGICLALNLEKAGYQVIGVDLSPSYIEAINTKTLKSPEPFVSEYLQSSNNFQATTNFQKVVNEAIEILFVTVATPSTPEWGYDHSQVEQVIGQLISFGKSAWAEIGL